MNKIWVLNFTAMMPVPGNTLSLFFDDEAKCLNSFNEYSKVLQYHQKESTSVIVIESLLGRHVIRPEFFPVCEMRDCFVSEATWRDIDTILKQVREQVGTSKKFGFEANNQETSMTKETA